MLLSAVLGRVTRAADQLLSGPFGAVKRFAFRESEPDSLQHIENMSFAQELVIPRESAVGTMRFSRLRARSVPAEVDDRTETNCTFLRQALPAVVKGIHTRVISNSSTGGSEQNSDPLDNVSFSSGQASLPDSVSASRPAGPPILPFRPDPQQLKEVGLSLVLRPPWTFLLAVCKT